MAALRLPLSESAPQSPDSEPEDQEPAASQPEQAAPAQRGNWRRVLRQFLTYTVIGGTSSSIEIGSFNLLLWLFASTRPSEITLMAAISYMIASWSSYQGHRRWTFRARSSERVQYRRFLMLNSFMLGLGTLLVYIFATVLPQLLPLTTLQSANLSKLLALVVSGIGSFLINKLWVFRS